VHFPKLQGVDVTSSEIVFQLKVTLRGSRPPIWRRVLVRSDISLLKLHGVLQVLMGWTDSHLHQFEAGGVFYGTPDPEFGAERKNERKVRLNEVLRHPKNRMVYEYDFGDSWEHDVVLEKVVPREPKVRYPVVTGGKRACPPEDVGGVWGYAAFLEAVRDPQHPDHEEMLEWCGDEFDAERFDVGAANRAFHGGWEPSKPDA
jgi:hypothetical protein